MTWLGEVSFGVYLYHLPVLLLIRRTLLGLPSDPNRIVALPAGQVLLLAVAAFAGGIGLGAASWYAVERPAVRFGARRRPAKTAPAALARRI